MTPVVVSVVLEPDAAVCLWARGSNTGKLYGPGYTVTAIVQRMVDDYSGLALSDYSGRALELNAAREAFQQAHADLPHPDRQPPSVLVVNLPKTESIDSVSAPIRQVTKALVVAPDDEL